MGYIRHDTVLVAVEDSSENLPDIPAFRESLPEGWRPLVVGPVSTPLNGTHVYAFLPDGSKEGWRDSDSGDYFRQEFVALFETKHSEVVTVSFGGDYGVEVGATVEREWPR